MPCVRPTLNLSCSELASCSDVKNQSTCWMASDCTATSTAGMVAGAAAGKGGWYVMDSTLGADAKNGNARGKWLT